MHNPHAASCPPPPLLTLFPAWCSLLLKKRRWLFATLDPICCMLSSLRVLRRLFATLDPTLRRVLLPSGRDALLSDTVGFISDLPHQLVDAFQVWLALSNMLVMHNALEAAFPHSGMSISDLPHQLVDCLPGVS